VETRWGALVIFDYERDFPDASVAELELYSRGLLRFAAVLAGDDRQLGAQRRPGIADLDAELYDDAAAKLHSRLSGLASAQELRCKVSALLTAVNAQLRCAERQVTSGGCVLGAGELASGLVDVMALHVINWLWPLDEFERHLSGVFGNADLGRRCLLALMIPSRQAHMLDFHAHVLEAAGRASAGRRERSLAAARLAEEVGYLQGPGMPGMAAHPLENPGAAADLLMTRLDGNDAAALAVPLDGLAIAHQQATAERSAMYAAALAASSGSLAAWERTQAVAISCQIAADAEEVRKVIQNRALRLLRRIGQACDLEIASTGLTALVRGSALAPEARWS
jgi:hypothetical protein